MDVLKEMLRSSRVQLKSKETDIQRLNIKIKRLERTNEIRETPVDDLDEPCPHDSSEAESENVLICDQFMCRAADTF